MIEMKVKVGIIGTGYMGSAHARVYDAIGNCNLVGICDTNPEKKILTKKHHCRFFSNLEDMLRADIDAVNICTPTSTHREIALQALERGKHVFIEKPLASNIQSGEEIAKKAKKAGRLIAVGYLERFNPAIKKLKETVDFSKIYSTISLRFGPAMPRIKNIGVLLDLGSHEIDILNYLIRPKPKILYTYISNNLNSNFEDYAYVSLKYDKTHAHIETSWIPNYKLRRLILYGKERFYILDYMQQSLKSCRAPPRVKMESGNWQDLLWISRNIEENVSVAQEEPLKLELQHFISSVERGELLDPLCDSKEAIEVLKTVQKAFVISKYSPHLKANS